jgi:photoactive yellow protein
MHLLGEFSTEASPDWVVSHIQVCSGSVFRSCYELLWRIQVSLKRVEELAFSSLGLGHLIDLTKAESDTLPFGIVGLSREGMVEVYNLTEATLAGIQAESVIGSHFFLSTAQCMNNFMVAQRLEDEAELDTIIDYVLTFRMRPTPVRLRLLKSAAHQRSYLLIQR